MKKFLLALASLATVFAITACSGSSSIDHCAQPENKGKGECIGA
jgi:hypothetical protein